MAGKRKAEGIALLSLYNDEAEDDDEEEDEEEEAEEADREHNSPELNERDSEGAAVAEISEIRAGLDTYGEEAVLLASSRTEAFIPSPTADKPGNGAHGIIVDYAHDEVALSPDAEEGEIMSTGRAVIGLSIQSSNGVLHVVSPPNARNVTPENRSADEQVEELDMTINQDQTTTASTLDVVEDVEMSESEAAKDTSTSDTDALADFLPPAPPKEKCSDELQLKFAKYLALKNSGRSFNEELRKSKGYRNPDFLQRAVKYQEIDQIGSCFKKEIFDPHGYDPSDFYDSLALEFKREQERKEQAKKQSQRVDFVHGGVQTVPTGVLPDKTKPLLPITAVPKVAVAMNPLTNAPTTIASAPESVSKSDTGRSNKKSKWDKVDTDSRAPASLAPAGKTGIAATSAHSALLTANAGGGYASFAQQKRKEVEERSRSTEKKSDRK